MKVVHIITDMGVGGAPIMLQRLVQELQLRGVLNTVIALGAMDTRFEGLAALGVTLHALGMRPRLSSLGGFFRLRRLLVESGADVIHTWMYHADLLGGLAARSAGLRSVVWGLHHTPNGDECLNPLTRAIIRVNGLLSSWLPSRIICCAEAAQTAHAGFGYAVDRMVLVRNGFDIETFHPASCARASVRRELGIPDAAPLVGLMARFHPQKDHRTFIRAASLLAQQRPDGHFLLAGRNVNARNPVLRSWLAEAGVTDCCHLLGTRDDMPRLMAACDIVSSSASVGEAFPLVLGEAMACGVPCVTTDVGDSAQLVGDTGLVVPPAVPAALAEAWASILALSCECRRQLGARARERVTARFQLGRCADEHLEVYAGVLSASGALVAS